MGVALIGDDPIANFSSDRPRIIHVVRQFWPSVGGLEDVVLNLCTAQRARYGFEPAVVTLDSLFTEPAKRLAPRDSVADVPIFRIGWRGSSRYPLAPDVLRFIGSADLVHVHGVDFFFDFLAWTKPFHRRPLVASTHGGFFHTQFAAGLKKLYFGSATRLSSRCYDAIVACSDADADMFRRITPQNLGTIENGANIAKFRDCASQTHRRTLIYFGRFAIHKRIASLFGLLRELRRLQPDWNLIVAGSEGDVTADELTATAETAGVRDAVEFVLRPSDAELRRLIGTASYFACPSAHEGFGIAAVEALSAGLIPVLSDIPPFAKLTSRAGLGMTYDPDDAARAAARVNRLVSNDAAYDALRQRAMDAAISYDWAAVAGTYVSLYRAVLARNRPH